MLAWVVIDRQHLRQAAPFASLHSSPLFPLPHLSPLLPVAYALHLPTAAPQPLCNQPVTHSFYLDGGAYPPVALPARQRSSRMPIPYSLSLYFSISCALFCTFLHSPNIQLFYFQAIPHSASKNTTTGVGEEDKLPAENTAQDSVVTSLPHYILASSSERKQHRLGGRSIGDGLEFWVLPPERLWHLHFRSLQDADQLQGIDDGLALKVIVGHHKRLAGALCDFADARDPGSQLFGGVEIVVTLMRRDRCIVAKPCVVAPAVKPNVPDGRGGLS
jgi:hypothetical protein